jgi:hypothetical protein
VSHGYHRSVSQISGSAILLLELDIPVSSSNQSLVWHTSLHLLPVPILASTSTHGMGIGFCACPHKEEGQRSTPPPNTVMYVEEVTQHAYQILNSTQNASVCKREESHHVVADIVGSKNVCIVIICQNPNSYHFVQLSKDHIVPGTTEEKTQNKSQLL